MREPADEGWVAARVRLLQIPERSQAFLRILGERLRGARRADRAQVDLAEHPRLEGLDRRVLRVDEIDALTRIVRDVIQLVLSVEPVDELEVSREDHGGAR